jgi:4-amino-4-deoxy-L-arabinose transferase-like glycosyltransferase
MPGKRSSESDGRWDMAVGVAFLLLALATCWSTIGSGFQLGGDEHHEVTKAFLWSEGFSLYHEIWNDQPPLLTVLQGSLFKWFGVYAVLARGLALAFGALLAAGLFRLVRKSLGVPAAFGALFSLLAAPHVFELSISPMSEVPAFAVGLGALGAIRRWDKDGRSVWLAISGLILAFALEIKVTAVLLAPALGLELAILTLARTKAGRIVKLARNGAIWGGSVLGGLVLLGLALGTGYLQAYASHFSTLGQAAAAEVRQLAFAFGDFLRYRQALVALAAALGLAAWRRHWRPLAFPLALFATALAVHLVHRPFWPYYYLHFAVPIAWLMGYAVGELWKAALDAVRRTKPRLSLWGTGLALAAALLSAGVVAYAGVTLASETKKIRGVRRVDADPVVAAMKAAAPGTQWVYTRATMYAFHAKLRVIPQLALMPRKRFWSGQITRAGILALVKRYMPEQLLLDDRDMADAEMAQFVGEHYRASTRDAGLTLWLKVGR